MGLKSLLASIGPAHQGDGAFVPVALVPGCGVGDVDRREIVQVSAIFFRPSVGLLRISILFILLPPDYDGALIVFPCSSSGVHCFPMVCVSCLLSDPLAQGNENLDLILFIVSSSGRRQTPQEQKVSNSSMRLKHEWRWTVLDICPNSYNSMLPIS